MLKKISLLFVSVAISSPAFASIDMSATIICTYQKGQFLTKNEASNVSNSTPLKWEFHGLSSKNPLITTGGKNEKVLPIPIQDGFVIYLSKPVGISTFSIWRTGESLLSKQEKVAGTVYGQQFIGNCVN